MFLGYLLLLVFSTVLLYYSATITVTSNSAADDKDGLEHWISIQEKISYQGIINNINTPNTARGFLAASLSTFEPDYYYTWTRDSALVVRILANIEQTNETLLEDYIYFQIQAQSESTVCRCLGEPKFNPDGSSYTGSWGRPQNDGPAERAITFMLILNRWAQTGYKNHVYLYSVLVPAITKDLDYVVSVWEEACFDLWEETVGDHFFTLMVMRRALLDAVDLFSSAATTNHYYSSVVVYKNTAGKISDKIQTFWSQELNYIMATQNIRNGAHKPSGLDVSTLLAASLSASRNDGFFTPGSDKILATAVALEDSFKSMFPINHQHQQDHLGTSIGRYPEDVYNGHGTSVGNPWFLATLAYTELYYLAIQEWKQTGIMINDINRRFFERITATNSDRYYYAPGTLELDQLIYNAMIKADEFLATVRYHQDRNGSMSEQFDRYIGYMTGARDLTWSHAAFISASKARSNTPIQ